MKNILALVDFSSVSGPVIDHAAELAGLYEAKLWIIHVAAPDPDFVGFEVGPQYIRDSRAEELSDEHKILITYQKKVQESGIECAAMLVQGHTGTTILEKVEKLSIDLLVLGSHGHGAVFHLLVGSVCQEMLKESPVPLLVIPSEDER